MPDTVLSDETWAALDPRAGALTPRSRAGVWRAAWMTLAALIAIVLVWRSGILVPRLSNGSGSGGSADSAKQEISVNQEVVNRGWHTEHLIAIGRSGPGLGFERVEGLPRTLAAGERATVTLFFHVTDCSAVRPEPWPIPIRVHRPWGSMTTELLPPDMGGLTVDDDTQRPWQVTLSRAACGVDGATP